MKRLAESLFQMFLWSKASADSTFHRLEEIKKSIAEKLEQTSKLNMENAEATKELEAMRQAHYMVLDSLKIQMETLDKELQTIRNTR